MKKTILFVILGVLVCGQSFAVELLTDPGMDLVGSNGQLGATPNAPWVVKATRGATDPFNDGAASEGFADVSGDPNGFGLFYKAFVGNPPWDPNAGSVDASITQAVAGTAGQQYLLTGWWGAEPNYSGLNTPGANSIFALDFLNGGGGLIGSAELDLEAAGLGVGGIGGLHWKEFSVLATVPAGTASVRARGSMLDGAFFQDPGQALVTDDWSLTAVPEPTSLVLAGLSLVGVIGLRRRS